MKEKLKIGIKGKSQSEWKIRDGKLGKINNLGEIKISRCAFRKIIKATTPPRLHVEQKDLAELCNVTK